MHSQKSRAHKGFGPKIEKLIPNVFLQARISVNPTDVASAANDIKPYDHVDPLDFQKLKASLNATKSSIDKYALAEKTSASYSRLAATLTLTNDLREVILRKYNGQFTTRAWIKFYEMYSHYPLTSTTQKSLFAFLNAELPGASICALNHYMKTMLPDVKFDWRASSLVVKEGTSNKINALDDQYGLWEKNRDKWLMSDTNDGNMTVVENILAYEKIIGTSCDLYTHDAGIDVSDDFNLQEYKNMKIHLGCALAGFVSLKFGGNFVAKQYTFFETFTIDLILIYASLFDEFYICKPTASGPSNSEIYLVGLGFRGLPKSIRDLLFARMSAFTTHPFLPKDKAAGLEATKEIYRFCRLLTNRQIAYINEGLTLFEKSQHAINKLSSGIEWARKQFEEIWLKKYPIKRIESKDHLAARPPQRSGPNIAANSKDKKKYPAPGSHANRQLR